MKTIKNRDLYIRLVEEKRRSVTIIVDLYNHDLLTTDEFCYRIKTVDEDYNLKIRKNCF